MKKYIFLIVFLLAHIFSCHVYRFVAFNFADLDDYKKFHNRTILSPENKFRYASVNSSEKVSRIMNQFGDSTLSDFEKRLKKSKSAALLIIQRDTIIYEWYDHKKDTATIMTSFSMAKSFVSILLGIAIDEGYIKSINEPITNYIKDFKNPGFEKITIEDVLRMETGIDYVENYYSPFGNVAVGYYGRDLDQHLYKIKIKSEPGKDFEYISIASQILGVIISNATGKTLSEYMQEKIWLKLGMEYDASWSLDKKDGREKAFCCLNARTRDYAKIGRLYLHNGKWNGEQIVSSDWVKQSTQYHPEHKNRIYGLHWWLDTPLNGTTQNHNFFALGHLGQYLYVCPEKEMIMVRIGYNYGNISWNWMFNKISEKF